VGISGIAAVLIAHSALAVVGGKKFVVTAIVAGEMLPEGALEGAVMHWGCSGSGGGSWLPPPAGWHTIPPISTPAGGGHCSSLSCSAGSTGSFWRNTPRQWYPALSPLVQPYNGSFAGQCFWALLFCSVDMSGLTTHWRI